MRLLTASRAHSLAHRHAAAAPSAHPDSVARFPTASRAHALAHLDRIGRRRKQTSAVGVVNHKLGVMMSEEYADAILVGLPTPQYPADTVLSVEFNEL